MTRKIHVQLISVLMFAASLLLSPGAFAQEGITKLVVPVAAGGAPDIVARVIAGPLSKRIGQTVIVENRPGAGERIGAEFVANAQPDGRTLLLAPPGTLVLAPFLFSDLKYDPQAFAPVGVLTSGHLVLLARNDLGLSTAEQLVHRAKEAPGKLTYASPGVGTPPHLTGEMFQLATGIRAVHVPYKGLAPALADLMAGHVDFMFDNLGNSLASIKAGRVKALAVASDERIAELPQVPTIAESYPGVHSASWFGVVAPPKTPADVCANLSQAFAEVLKSPEVAAKLHAMSLKVVGSSPAEMATFLTDERTRWQAVVRAANIHVD
jgi:tripartite-type tricarboxylate transporter receptor subunit TctC